MPEFGKSDVFVRANTFTMERKQASWQRKEAFYARHIPTLPLPAALLCCLLNFIIPGGGSLVAAFIVPCTPSSQRERGGKESDPLGDALQVASIGLCQMVCVVLVLLGWLWSAVWGVWMVELALMRRKELADERAKLARLATIKSVIIAKNGTVLS